MDRVAAFSPADRQALFQEVAARRSLSVAIIEKDFWVCWTLRRLFSLPTLGENLIFKGGTSLSKVFSLIERFSEDIDLSIGRDYLGVIGEKDPEQDGISHNQRRKRVDALRQNCRLAVREEMLPALQESFAAHLGIKESAIASNHTWKLELDPEDEGTLLFSYPSPSALTTMPAYIRPQVKLEMGAGSDPFPIGYHTVRPYAADTFPEMFEDPEVTVIALEAERTFWEKATLLHAMCHWPADKPIPARLSRHYYDLMRLSLSTVGQRALLDKDLRERVVTHKSTYFASSRASYETAHPGTFQLVPHDDRVTEIRRDYAQMRDMIFADVPLFEDILTAVTNLEKNINQGKEP